MDNLNAEKLIECFSIISKAHEVAFKKTANYTGISRVRYARGVSSTADSFRRRLRASLGDETPSEAIQRVHKDFLHNIAPRLGDTQKQGGIAFLDAIQDMYVPTN